MIVLFDVNEIESPIPGRYACRYIASSEKEAEMIVASFLMSVRMRGVGAELYRFRVVEGSYCYCAF